MRFSDKFIRTQLELSKPLADASSLETARAVQDRLGRILRFVNRKLIVVREEMFDGVPGAVIIPRDEVRSGVILYLHGGGYAAGSLDYSKGFASIISAECGMRVITAAYRLAPENPYPAALDDALAVYKHLLDNGYSANTVMLAGESAGGGLCYALALKLRDIGLPMPAGIIAISPWCDLTLSGESYASNKEKDPSLSKEKLKFFADCYIGAVKDTKFDPKKDEPIYQMGGEDMKKSPFVSPLFADLHGMPPSLIFAGGDEILLSDSVLMNDKLKESGAKSELYVRAGMWHAYHLYCLKSSEYDFELINDFIKRTFPKDSERKLRWMGLDNCAKIYPAAATSRWTNVFRLSATLSYDVDREVLQSALDVTVRRFPSISVRLRRGTFWYYLEEIAHAPEVMDEKPYPLSRMPFDDIRSCAFRVLIYKKRIAVEFFHALTDGNGGLVFLKSLLAEYLSQKYGAKIPNTDGVLDRLEKPSDEELEDSFIKYAGKYSVARRDTDSYRIWGDLEPDGFCHDTTFIMDSNKLLDCAHRHGVTVTALLSAAVIKAAIGLQNLDTPRARKQKHIKVLIPCDLRRIYKSKSLRNFALYATPGIDPRLGEYTFSEICEIVQSQMKLEITEKNMSTRIKTNVKDEENPFLKVTPLFLKNIIMKTVFMLVGEKKSMLSLSNLGVVKIPDEMKKYIDRFDFVLSVQSRAPYNIGVLSYNGLTYLNVIRNIIEPRLEMALYRVLRDENIAVKVESNQR